MTKEQRDIKHKLAVLSHGEESGNISKTCRYYGISRDIPKQKNLLYFCLI